MIAKMEREDLMKTENILEVTDLKTYFFRGKKIFKAVDGVSFHIEKGETLCIVGESGSGKSITSLSIMGLIPEPGGRIESGSITFDGKDLTSITKKEMMSIRGNDVSMIFQEPMTSLNPVLTIGFQVMEPLIEHRKWKKKNAKEKAIELLNMVGIARADEIFHSYPHQLSGGMRQRVMIAIAISCDPKLLIADEPTTALDVTIQAQILDLLRTIKDDIDSSILLITHDLGVVAEMASRVIVMYGGQIVEEATVEEIFDFPKHPYTKGLLGSVPKLEEERDRLIQIKGIVPSADKYPKGCRFAPRCKFARSECFDNEIMLRKVNSKHFVRCVLYDDPLVKIKEEKK